MSARLTRRYDINNEVVHKCKALCNFNLQTNIFCAQDTRGGLYIKCKNIFGQHADTLRIENAAEWNYLKTELGANFPCQGCSKNSFSNIIRYDKINLCKIFSECSQVFLV